ncbi:MAG: InlB B-repeat-containing protein [Bacilli bacterium]|nr:InlB B-repeat-containing protein [Bacilli bacterium]
MKLNNLLKLALLATSAFSMVACGGGDETSANTSSNENRTSVADSSTTKSETSSQGGQNTGKASDQNVASLTVKTMPTKVSYVLGETFDPAGGVLTVKYADKTTAEVEMTDERVTFTALNSKSVGTKTVKATFGGKSVAFKVTVTKEMIAVTFNSNGGSEVASSEVEKGKTLTEPTAPTKDGFTFDGWYTDTELTLAYDFTTVVEGTFTLNAKWLEANKTVLNVTFDYGYYGALPAKRVLHVVSGDSVSKISVDPTRKGYVFAGWVTSTGTNYDFTAAVSSDITLTANWTRSTTELVGEQTYVFEAEDVNFTGIVGKGLSGTATETACIVNESAYGASNDRYVSYLYQLGLGLTFQLNCDVDISNVTLVARLSQFIEDYTYTSESWKVTVNGTDVNYSPISFSNVPAMADSTATPLPFADFTLGNVSLKKGKNTIQLLTNNNDAIQGTTMESHCPLIDCLKFTATNYVLEWDAVMGYPFANY